MEINIKELRKQLHLSQQSLAVILKVSVRTVTAWEAHDFKPSQLSLRKLERLARKRGFRGGLTVNYPVPRAQGVNSDERQK